MADGDDTNINRYISTGSYVLNALLSGSIYGGLAGNRITALAGEPSTGKTFFALSLCKQFLTDHPNGRVFYFESESAISKDMLADRDIAIERFAILPVETVQQFRTQALNVIDSYLELNKKEKEELPILFVLDSLGNLSTSKEMEDIKAGKDTRDMTRAQLVRGCFRTLSLRLGRAKIPLIVTNHVYDTIGTYIPTKEMGGGQGLKYAASTIVFLTKKKDRVDKDVVGAIITATLAKSRLTIEHKKVQTLLNFDKGLNKYYGLTDLALKFGIWTKMAKGIEIDGKRVFEKSINDDPESYFTEEVLQKINDACEKEFLYGKTDFIDVVENVE